VSLVKRKITDQPPNIQAAFLLRHAIGGLQVLLTSIALKNPAEGLCDGGDPARQDVLQGQVLDYGIGLLLRLCIYRGCIRIWSCFDLHGLYLAQLAAGLFRVLRIGGELQIVSQVKCRTVIVMLQGQGQS
jgi:hypothetical protein